LEIVYGAALLKNATPAKKREALFRYRQLPEFGNWCGALFENARHKLGKDSVFRYRQLVEFGESLLKARKQFASDNEYGDWVKRSIPEKLNTAKKRTTLFNYRDLAEFGNS